MAARRARSAARESEAEPRTGSAHARAERERARTGRTDSSRNSAERAERSSARAGRGDSQIAPPPWQHLPDRRGGRRSEPISRDAIVAAAIDLMDAEGLGALSMRRLAEQFDTGAASLYWHVGSKDGLLDLVLDQLISEVSAPEPDQERWQEQIREVARAQRAVSLRHPYMVRISFGRIPLGPAALRLSDRVLGILRAGGLPPRLAVQGYLLLIATVNGFTMDETGVEDPSSAAASGSAGQIDDVALQDAANMVRDYLESLPAGQFPNMVAMAEDFAIADRDERFEMLLDIFIDGLARRARVQNGQRRSSSG
jgi:AcrR family transcriptional regulator